MVWSSLWQRSVKPFLEGVFKAKVLRGIWHIFLGLQKSRTQTDLTRQRTAIKKISVPRRSSHKHTAASSWRQMNLTICCSDDQ